MLEYWKNKSEIGTIAEKSREIWEKISFGADFCGEKENIENVTNEKINEVAKKMWSKENITIGFSGPAEASKVISLLEPLCSDFPSISSDLNSDFSFKSTKYVEDLDCSKGQGIVSYPGVSVKDPVFPVFEVLLEAIGRDYAGLPCQIARNLRKVVKSNVPEVEKFRGIGGFYRDKGVIGVEFTADSSGKWKDVVKIGEIVLSELEKLDEQGLELVKTAVKMRIRQVLSEPEKRLQWLVRSQAWLGKTRSLEDELQSVSAIDLSQFHTVCSQTLHSPSSLVLLGPVVSHLTQN